MINKFKKSRRNKYKKINKLKNLFKNYQKPKIQFKHQMIFEIFYRQI